MSRGGLLESFHILLTLFGCVVSLVLWSVCKFPSLSLSPSPPLLSLSYSLVSLYLSLLINGLSLSCLLLGSICLYVSP